MAYDLFSSPIQHRLSKKSFVGPLATSSLAVGRFVDKKGSLRSPIGRLVASLDTTLRSHLVRPKDAVYPRKQYRKYGVLYKTHCECGNICIGETGRYMHERVKEHDRDRRLSPTQPFLNTPIKPGIILSGRRLSLLTDTLTGTLVVK